MLTALYTENLLGGYEKMRAYALTGCSYNLIYVWDDIAYSANSTIIT